MHKMKSSFTQDVKIRSRLHKMNHIITHQWNLYWIFSKVFFKYCSAKNVNTG